MSEQIRDFTDLIIWQKAVAVGKLVYELSGHFPSEERFGLTAQIRKAAVSISSNIAEGHARWSNSFAHFLDIARGSTAKGESQALFALELGYLAREQVPPLRSLASEIHRMAASLIEKLKRP